MDDDTDAGPAYEWATHAEPDFLALQVPPVPVGGEDGRLRDAFKVLMSRRGFRPPDRDDELGLPAANGCLLTRTSGTSLELLVTVGEGASRLALTDLDPVWLDRVVADGQVAVLVVDTAVADDGTTSRSAVRRDVEAGGVLGALVPAAEPAGAGQDEG